MVQYLEKFVSCGVMYTNFYVVEVRAEQGKGHKKRFLAIEIVSQMDVSITEIRAPPKLHG